MKIDLFKLNNLNSVNIDDSVEFPEDYFNNTDIRGLNNCHVSGKLEIDYEDDLYADLLVSGVFILPCAVSLEDVEYEFSTKIEQNLGKFDEFYSKNKNSLDILPFIWENIVSEVPIRVVKEGVKPDRVVGDGWELVSE